jgi:hypothetical protein
MEVGGQHHAQAAFPAGRDPVPIVQEASWAPWLLGWAWKISPPPEFHPWTVQPVANYTEYAIPAHNDNTTKANMKYEKLE